MARTISTRLELTGEQEFRKSMSAVNAQYKALQAEIKAVSAEFAGNATSQDALRAKNEILGRSVQVVQDKMSLLDGQLTRQREYLNRLGDELTRVIAAEGEQSRAATQAQNAYNQQAAVVSRLEADYSRTRAELSNLNREMREVEEASRGAGDALANDVLAGTAAWDLICTGIQATTQALREAVQTGMAFDSSVSDIAATMGTTVASLEELRGFALDMGASTAFSAAQAAQALNYMALAGYAAQTSMETLPNVLNLAAAGGIELAAASDMVTDAQSALGLSMEQTAVLVDEMAKASTKTNTSVAQLGEAILTVGGTAKFMRGGTAELNQVLGLLADNSIKGAEGGTKLRNIILSLSAPTEAAAKQLEELGVSVFDAEGNMRRFSEFFPELNRALSSLTDQKQIEALGEIFNSRDIAAAQALLGVTVERWGELETAIDGAAGSAQKMAETRLDNLAGDVTLFKSAADGAAIALSDSLTPALRGVTQAGTGIMTFAGEVINTFPLAGQAVAGLAAAGVTLGAGAVAAAGGITTATGAVTALTAAMAANPFGLIAVGVGAAVTALTGLAHIIGNVKEENDELVESLNASQAAYEDTKAAMEGQGQSLMESVSALESLAAVENKSAIEKEAMLALVNSLNESVPNLSLAYDEQTDSLNMTGEALRKLAQAELDRQNQAEAVERMKELLLEEAQITDRLAESKTREAEAEQELARVRAQIEIGDYTDKLLEYEQRLEQEQEQTEMLTGLLEENRAQQEALSDAFDITAESADEAASSMSSAEAGAEALSEAVSALEESTLNAVDAADMLSDALKEQEKEGSLTLQTAKELIEAGYGAALAIDEETGAVTLNRAEYTALANEKIQEQIATLEAAKASRVAAAALEVEKNAAYNAGSAYWEAAKAKAAQAAAGDTQAIDLQIAALKRAMNSLNSYAGASETAARRSSGSSKQIKTQAQKDLEEYKTLKAALDHEKNTGLVEEEAYYRRLGELRDQYLTSDANIDEYRKVTESIYKADQKALEEQEKALQQREKLWQDANDGILKLEEEFQQELSSRTKEILNSYKLFDEVPEQQKIAAQELLKNLQEQNQAVETFYSNLDTLAGRGVDLSLVDSIREMGVGAKDQLQALVDSSDEFLTQYAEEYGKKQKFANEQALKELDELRKGTNEKILEQLDDVAGLYETTGPALGLSLAQGMAQGIYSGLPLVEKASAALARAAETAVKEEEEIHSPSRKWRNLAGDMVLGMSEGLLSGRGRIGRDTRLLLSNANDALAAAGRNYNRDVEAMMSQPKQRVTTGDIGELLAGAVNGMNSQSPGSAYPMVRDITLAVDNRVLAQVQLEPLRQEARMRPESLDDK